MTTTSVKTQKRKTGDTLRLSGEFSLETVVDPDWTGASAVLNIAKDDDARTIWRDAEPLDVDLVANPKRYNYAGDPPLDSEAGDYLYEIQVTFADNTVITFPNDRYGYRLAILTELS